MRLKINLKAATTAATFYLLSSEEPAPETLPFCPAEGFSCPSGTPSSAAWRLEPRFSWTQQRPPPSSCFPPLSGPRTGRIRRPIAGRTCWLRRSRSLLASVRAWWRPFYGIHLRFYEAWCDRLAGCCHKMAESCPLLFRCEHHPGHRAARATLEHAVAAVCLFTIVTEWIPSPKKVPVLVQFSRLSVR